MKYFIYIVVILTVCCSLSLAFAVDSPVDVTIRLSTSITPGSGDSAGAIPAVLALLLMDSPPVMESPFEVTCPSDFYTYALSTQTLTGLVTGTFDDASWSILSAPIGSSRDFTVSGTNIELFFDVLGPYVLEFMARSLDGFEYTCQTTVTAYAPDILVVELSWATDDPTGTNTSDVDLFLHRAASGSYFYYWNTNPITDSPDNCYWNNCATCTVPYSNPDREQLCRSALASSPPPPAVLIWNGENPDANPRLELDDTNGNGPEVIRIASPDPGIYRVAVHYYDKNTATLPLNAQVRIHCGGELLYQSEPVLLTARDVPVDNDLWEVGDITIAYPGGIPDCSFIEFGGTGCHRICLFNEGQPGGCGPAWCE